jgi:hypothetical protein
MAQVSILSSERPGFKYQDVCSSEQYVNNKTAVKVQQNIEKPNPMTVFGEAPLTHTAQPGGAGRSYKGNAIFDATRAIA